MKPLAYTKTIILLALTASFPNLVLAYPPIDSTTTATRYTSLAERERVGPPPKPGSGVSITPPAPVLPKPGSVNPRPPKPYQGIPLPPEAPGHLPGTAPAAKNPVGNLPITPATPCGLNLKLKLRTRTVPSNAPFTLMVAAQLLENGKEVCSLYNFEDPDAGGFEPMTCDPEYRGSFEFATATGKLYKEGRGETMFSRQDGVPKEGQITWEWSTAPC